jgi:hypothetical protein
MGYSLSGISAFFEPWIERAVVISLAKLRSELWSLIFCWIVAFANITLLYSADPGLSYFCNPSLLTFLARSKESSIEFLSSFGIIIGFPIY